MNMRPALAGAPLPSTTRTTRKGRRAFRTALPARQAVPRGSGQRTHA